MHVCVCVCVCVFVCVLSKNKTRVINGQTLEFGGGAVDGTVKCNRPCSQFLVNIAFGIIQCQILQLLLYHRSKSWMQVENSGYLKYVVGRCAFCEGLLCLYREIFSYQRPYGGAAAVVGASTCKN